MGGGRLRGRGVPLVAARLGLRPSRLVECPADVSQDQRQHGGTPRPLVHVAPRRPKPCRRLHVERRDLRDSGSEYVG